MSDFLVLGATGKTGRRVVPRLIAAGHSVRAASRQAAAGVEFDWARPSTHASALAGADGVYLVAATERPEWVDEVAAFLDLAINEGVGRVVLLSARGADAVAGSPFDMAQRLVLGSGVPATVLQPAGFAQNFTEGFLAPDDGGAIRAPAGTGRMPFIDVADIADVAVAALTGDGHAGETYQLSGPTSLTFGDAAKALAAATGRDIHHVDVDPEEWRVNLVNAGVPADRVGFLNALFAYIRDGYEDVVNDGVERVLGRVATSFEDFANREAA